MTAILNSEQCAVAPGAAGAWLVTKTGGDPAAADASAVSAAAMAGDFVLRARALGDGTFYVGVSAAPLAGSGFASIDRALQISGDLARPFDSGVARPGTFTISGYVWMRRQGASLDYLNGAELATADLRRSVSVGTAPLWFDSALVTPGIPIEVKFDGPAAFAARRRRPQLSIGFGF